MENTETQIPAARMQYLYRNVGKELAFKTATNFMDADNMQSEKFTKKM